LPRRVTLFYDADCGFCRWSVARILARDRDGRLAAEPLQGSEAAVLLAGLSAQERMASAHVVTGDGAVHSGGDALAPVAAVLPRGAPVAALARTAGPLVRLGYRAVAAARGPLGRRLPPARIAAADEVIARHRARASGNA
jgi:predicted DCC family thiol-disulfide oxidoreductase YuxK